MIGSPNYYFQVKLPPPYEYLVTNDMEVPTYAPRHLPPAPDN